MSVHVEDGRYFLQATTRRYDLITAEPPPPKNAGVVNLYSAEYFALARRRLRPGGFLTYWLPVHSLEEDDSRAIVRSFCDAFADCTLWAGTELDWMLAGSNGAAGPVDEAVFRRQWDDAKVGPEIRRLGIEGPEQLGALFMADAEGLKAFVGAAEPLVDDRPQRLAPARRSPPGPAYARPRCIRVQRVGRRPLAGRPPAPDTRLLRIPGDEGRAFLGEAAPGAEAVALRPPQSAHGLRPRGAAGAAAREQPGPAADPPQVVTG